MDGRERAIRVGSGWKALPALLVVAFLSLAPSVGADPASKLSDAEAGAATAQAEVAAARQRLDEARAEYATAKRGARPVAAAARQARRAAGQLRGRLGDRQRAAKALIAEGEEARRQAEEDHDEEVATGIGFGIAALIAAGIAIAWGWFRASAAVAALVGMRLAQAVALCVGGGFLLVVVGAALGSADGLAAAVGTALFALGFLLPTALLLGRHSAEVQRGQATPLLKRERLPSWLARGVAVLFFLLGLGALGAALFADEPDTEPVSAQVRRDAEALVAGRGADRLARATTEAAEARRQATAPLAAARTARAALRQASRALRGAEDRLLAAEADVERFGRRLVALEEREERERARAEERELREAEEASEAEEESLGCDPNYSGCVPPYPPDVDCAEVGGSVSVYGSDPHGLDADGDGIGCE